MLLPFLQEVQNASKKYTVAFRGINYGEGTQDGEFADTYNLSTDQYPCITQRAARINVNTYKKPSTLHSKGQLLVIDERLDEDGNPTGKADVYYGDNPNPIGEVTSGKKQTATVGNYIVIFPDKKYYKVPTEDDKDGKFGDMEETITTKGLKFTASEISGKLVYKERDLAFTTNSITIPKIEYTGDTVLFEHYYIRRDGVDFSSIFKVGDVVTVAGSANNNVEAKITSVNGNHIYFANSTFGWTGWYYGTVTIARKVEKFQFSQGDSITITGCAKSENNKTVTVKTATEDTLTFDDGSFVEATESGEVAITRSVTFPFKKGDSVVISGCSKSENNKDAEIIIRGVSNDTLTFDNNSFTAITYEPNEVTITRTVPPLDFVCENNYRLWGTHGNTIYASKYSDPLNFKCFEGLAGDSYFIEVASEGEFTGCIPYSSHICFFKENTLHKLYGNKPSNYQLNTANVYGVQSGSEKSMHIVNEQLLYKGVGGVYSYTGGVPELISEKFGTKRYSEAVACCDGEIYYISMKQGNKWDMFSYDVLKNIWLREDDTQAVDMTFYDGKVYFLDAKGGLYYIDKTASRNDIEWGATFCTIHETMNERKVYSKFHLRMELSGGAWMAVDVKTDNDTQWKQVYTTHNEKARTVSIPIMPRRCDSIDIRLRGKGRCTIKAFIRELTVGSDV